MIEPEICYLEILRGRDVATGRPVWLIDAILEDDEGVPRCIMSDHYSEAEATVAAMEWECQGYRVFRHGGGR